MCIFVQTALENLYTQQEENYFKVMILFTE